MNSRILPGILLIVIIGIFFAYINPTWTGPIATSRAVIAADNQALATARQYTIRQNQLATARDNIDPASLTALNVLLPDSVDNVGLILDMNALADRSQLSVSSVDVLMGTAVSSKGSSSGALPSAATNPIGSVDLSLSAIGTYSALQTFLAGIEKSARILDIRDLTVTGSDTGVYSYHMIIRLYWLR